MNKEDKLRSKLIEELKKKAKRLYEEVSELREPYSCGMRLASYINPTIDIKQKEFEETMSQLAQLDPKYPKGGSK
jgi:hypothetical protein